MIDLHDEGDLVRPVPRHGAEHAERRGDRVAAALDGELDDLARVEVLRIGSERRACRVLDPLVDGEDRHVARAAEAAVLIDRGEVAQDLVGTVGAGPDAVDEIRSRQVQQRLRHRLAAVLEQGRMRRRRAAARRFGVGGSVAVAMVSPDANAGGPSGRRLPNLPGQPPPSSTVSGDGTPAHPWRATARGERRDLREQERFAPGDGGGAAHGPGGRARQRARYRGHLDDGPDARARGGRGRASRH